MKTITLQILLISFCIHIGFCQKAPLPNDTPKKSNSTKYDLQSRLKLYPFNQAVQIKLVSFDAQVDSSNKLLKPEYIYELPMKNDTICLSKVDGIVTLNPQQIDSLTDILYNTCFRWNIYETSKNGCYLPHNAIVFFDSSDKPFEFIEICFDCRQLKYSSNQIVQFEDCDYALDDLKEYFNKLGLKTSISAFEKKITR